MFESRFKLLCMLETAPRPQTSIELAESLGLRRIIVANQLSRAEKAGLVTRTEGFYSLSEEGLRRITFLRDRILSVEAAAESEEPAD